MLAREIRWSYRNLLMGRGGAHVVLEAEVAVLKPSSAPATA
jgi:hypothetical protein